MLAAFLALLLTLSFVMLTVSTLAGLQLGNQLLRPSPFGAFEAIWPGQSIENLAAYGRQTSLHHLPCLTGVSPRQEYLGLEVRVAVGAYSTLGQTITCADHPTEGVFRVVSLTIENARIQQLKLYSDVLREDVLLLYWGMPDFITSRENQQSLALSWEQSGYSAVAVVNEPDSVVKVITLTARE